jgi:hypothetical protein
MPGQPGVRGRGRLHWNALQSPWEVQDHNVWRRPLLCSSGSGPGLPRRTAVGEGGSPRLEVLEEHGGAAAVGRRPDGRVWGEAGDQRRRSRGVRLRGSNWPAAGCARRGVDAAPLHPSLRAEGAGSCVHRLRKKRFALAHGAYHGRGRTPGSRRGRRAAAHRALRTQSTTSVAGSAGMAGGRGRARCTAFDGTGRPRLSQKPARGPTCGGLLLEVPSSITDTQSWRHFPDGGRHGSIPVPGIGGPASSAHDASCVPSMKAPPPTAAATRTRTRMLRLDPLLC